MIPNHCPICKVLLRPSLLLCGMHWKMVPDELQRRIWSLYRRARGGDEHRAACFEAIALVEKRVNQKEGVS